MSKLQKNTNIKLKLPKKIILNPARIPFIKLMVIFTFINFITITLVFIAKNNIPPQVPLFYGYARGDKQLSPTLGLIIPSLISICIIFTNTIISLFMSSDYLKKVLIITSLLVTALSAVTTVKIVFLVGSF